MNSTRTSSNEPEILSSIRYLNVFCFYQIQSVFISRDKTSSSKKLTYAETIIRSLRTLSEVYVGRKSLCIHIELCRSCICYSPVKVGPKDHVSHIEMHHACAIFIEVNSIQQTHTNFMFAISPGSLASSISD